MITVDQLGGLGARRDVQLFSLAADSDRDRAFIHDLLAPERTPIFEQSYLYITCCISYQSALYALSGPFGKAVLATGPSTTFLMSPLVSNSSEFEILLSQLLTMMPSHQLNIRYLTESWIDINVPRLNSVSVIVRPRSTAEAIYDIHTLTRLQGPDFRNLRARRRKLLDSGRLTFRALSESGGLKDGIAVLEAWQRTQGLKYAKNRMERELYTINQFAKATVSPDEASFDVGYFDGRPVAVAFFYRSQNVPEWATIHFVKGINHVEHGGTSGVSDATYCHVFELAERRGIVHLNDGELGTEEGTREHKLQFEPVRFLKSFDLIVRQR